MSSSRHISPHTLALDIPDDKNDSVVSRFREFYAPPLKKIIENYLTDEATPQLSITLHTRLRYKTQKEHEDLGSFIKSTFKSQIQSDETTPSDDKLTPKQHTLLGIAYTQGIGVETDLKKAEQHLTKAHLKNALAKALLGELICKNTTREKEYLDGIALLRQALLDPEYLAHLLLSELYAHKNKETQATENYTKAAYYNVPEGLFRLGQDREKEFKLESDDVSELSPRLTSAKAFWSLYEDAAQLGSVDALIRMASLLEQGTTVKKNIKKATTYYQLAAKYDANAQLAYQRLSKQKTKPLVTDLFSPSSTTPLLVQAGEPNCCEKIGAKCTIL